jgi:hypothetical protein
VDNREHRVLDEHDWQYDQNEKGALEGEGTQNQEQEDYKGCRGGWVDQCDSLLLPGRTHRAGTLGAWTAAMGNMVVIRASEL